MLAKYPKLWGELSYRSGITEGGGKLTPEWRSLFERYPDRFLLGSDTWVPERWASYGEIMAGYRAWLAQLAAEGGGANRAWQRQGAVRGKAPVSRHYFRSKSWCRSRRTRWRSG